MSEQANMPFYPAQEIGPIGMPNHEMLYGLTKREYFAGLAMQGLSTATSEDVTWQHDAKDCAAAAVDYADELLARLEATK